MASLQTVIAANLDRVRQRIAGACKAAGRQPDEIRLVAVTKSASLDAIRVLLELGVRELGESRPQQLVERAALLPSDVNWHLVGHLQRNKVRKVLPLARWIHSVDTHQLLDRLDQLAPGIAARPRVLLEVNVSGEPAKHGFEPQRLIASWPTIAERSHVDLVGLMTMAPLENAGNAARQTFAKLRTVRDALLTAFPVLPLPELSMGMSGDFEAAICEGATLIRLGTVLFEGIEPGAAAPC